MVSKLHVVKFVFRLAKMCSMSILVGLAVFNFFFGKIIEESVKGTQNEEIYKMILAVSGSVLIFSGLANINLVKRSKKNSFWLALILTKFILALVLTPLFVSPSIISYLSRN